MSKIALLCLILVGVLWFRHHMPAPTAAVTRASAVKTAPATFVSQPIDPRSQAEWEADCDPAWAAQIGTGISAMWCRTPYNNKFDYDLKLPASWRWM